ncbi:MAG: GGDEF-domain containing protein, partial [Methylococcales bacterium]|nr:GGDEF-domain containing protein [Methylococcales bacterium]
MMNKTGILFSLKWKIAILIGGVFLLLHSAFSYLVYLDTTENFVRNRINIQSRYSNVAYALTKDSFLVLEQFSELFSVTESDKPGQNNASFQIIYTVDKNWQQWQFIWGLESAVFFNQAGELVKQWGGTLKPKALSVINVLKKESPDHQIICPDTCFQFVMIPVMENSEIIGVFGVSRSFASTVIEYNRATGSDLGVLVSAEQSLLFNWPYRLSAMTHLDRNKTILDIVTQGYSFA